jgi:ABC-type transporter MlaC component
VTSGRHAPRAIAGAVLLGVASWAPSASLADDPARRAPRATGASLEQATAELTKLNAAACNAGAPGVPAVFDVDEMARRALGRHWRDRSELERGRFTRRFASLFGRWYRGLCERQGQPHLGRPVAEGAWAHVPAVIMREGRRVSLVYRLHERRLSPEEARWLVYDVDVNGRSRLRAFYAEFDRIILNEGYADLVGRLDASARPADL